MSRQTKEKAIDAVLRVALNLLDRDDLDPLERSRAEEVYEAANRLEESQDESEDVIQTT